MLQLMIEILEENDQVQEKSSNDNDEDPQSQDQETTFVEVESEESCRLIEEGDQGNDIPMILLTSEEVANSCRDEEEDDQGNQNDITSNRDSDDNSAMEESNQVEAKTIEGYYVSLASKSFKETLKFQKENILHLPSREENVHPLTLEERTRIDTIIAIALFILR